MTAHFLKAKLFLNAFFLNSVSICQWKQSGIFTTVYAFSQGINKAIQYLFQLQINECFSKGFIRVKVKF